MSFINTALFTSRFGTYWWFSDNLRTRENVYKKIILIRQPYIQYLKNEGFLDIESNGLNFDNFDYVRYNQEFSDPNFWFSTKNFSVTHHFFIFTPLNIALSVFAQFFHDKMSCDLTEEINDYFGYDISPYFITGLTFGVSGMFIGVSQALAVEHVVNDFKQPWVYSFIVSEGFFYGTAAIAASYFGDE